MRCSQISSAALKSFDSSAGCNVVSSSDKLVRERAPHRQQRRRGRAKLTIRTRAVCTLDVPLIKQIAHGHSDVVVRQPFVEQTEIEALVAIQRTRYKRA